MMPKDHTYKFIISDFNCIEARNKLNGEFQHTICCENCLHELEKQITKLKKILSKVKE